HLGVLSTVNEQAATDVFVRDCLVYLGTCVAPIGQGKEGERCTDYTMTFGNDRKSESGTLAFGELKLLSLGPDERAQVTLQPAKHVDAGEGRGKSVTREVRGGVVGLLLDGRGRPLQMPTKFEDRLATLSRWHQAVGLYPK
ncbi:MAG: methylaspartate mutase, partial [Nitrospirota bacterium]|nr:methylaspartate mutase [Nitrospirota bacterium]